MSRTIDMFSDDRDAALDNHHQRGTWIPGTPIFVCDAKGGQIKVSYNDIESCIFRKAPPRVRNGRSPGEHAAFCRMAFEKYKRKQKNPSIELSEEERIALCEWFSVANHLRIGMPNPYEDRFCRYCGDQLPNKRFGVGGQQQDERFTCSVEKVGKGYKDERKKRGCESRCASDLARSRNGHARGDIGTIGFIGMWIESDFYCFYCKRYFSIIEVEGDHRNPGSKEDGIRVICRQCNVAKHKMTEEEMIANPPVGMWRYPDEIINDQAMMETLRNAAIIESFYYCKHKRIKERCEAIIEGRKDLEIHPYDEEYAPIVLGWIKAQEKMRAGH